MTRSQSMSHFWTRENLTPSSTPRYSSLVAKPSRLEPRQTRANLREKYVDIGEFADRDLSSESSYFWLYSGVEHAGKLFLPTLHFVLIWNSDNDTVCSCDGPTHPLHAAIKMPSTRKWKIRLPLKSSPHLRYLQCPRP